MAVLGFTFKGYVVHPATTGTITIASAEDPNPVTLYQSSLTVSDPTDIYESPKMKKLSAQTTDEASGASGSVTGPRMVPFQT